MARNDQAGDRRDRDEGDGEDGEGVEHDVWGGLREWSDLDEVKW